MLVSPGTAAPAGTLARGAGADTERAGLEAVAAGPEAAEDADNGFAAEALMTGLDTAAVATLAMAPGTPGARFVGAGPVAPLLGLPNAPVSVAETGADMEAEATSDGGSTCTARAGLGATDSASG
mgnify:CR=1 FL=1